jgi:prophage maintenance system killer protein
MAHEDSLPTVDEIHAVHKKIVDLYDLPKGTLLDNVDAKIEAVLEDIRKDEDADEYDTAAQFLSRFITRSPYRAGNQATGWLVTTIYLSRTGGSIDPEVLKMAPYVVQAVDRYPSEELAEWLQTGTINTDPFEEEANAA